MIIGNGKTNQWMKNKPTGVFGHSQLSCNVQEHLFRKWFVFHPTGLFAHHFPSRFKFKGYIQKLVRFSSNLFVWTSISCIDQSILLKNTQFIFHPTDLFAHSQLLCSVEQHLFRKWFVFHPTNLFAHSQLSCSVEQHLFRK